MIARIRIWLWGYPVVIDDEAIRLLATAADVPMQAMRWALRSRSPERQHLMAMMIKMQGKT